jgi:hypothetical protein
VDAVMSPGGKDIQAGFSATELLRGGPRWNRRSQPALHQMPAAWAGLRWVDLGAAPSLARVGDRAGYEASSNQSSACGGARAGAKVAGAHGKPSAASRVRARAESGPSRTVEDRLRTG